MATKTKKEKEPKTIRTALFKACENCLPENRKGFRVASYARYDAIEYKKYGVFFRLYIQDKLSASIRIQTLGRNWRYDSVVIYEPSEYDIREFERGSDPFDGAMAILGLAETFEALPHIEGAFEGTTWPDRYRYDGWLDEWVARYMMPAREAAAQHMQFAAIRFLNAALVMADSRDELNRVDDAVKSIFYSLLDSDSGLWGDDIEAAWKEIAGAIARDRYVIVPYGRDFRLTTGIPDYIDNLPRHSSEMKETQHWWAAVDLHRIAAYTEFLKELTQQYDDEAESRETLCQMLDYVSRMLTLGVRIEDAKTTISEADAEEAETKKQESETSNQKG